MYMYVYLYPITMLLLVLYKPYSTDYSAIWVAKGHMATVLLLYANANYDWSYTKAHPLEKLKQCTQS